MFSHNVKSILYLQPYWRNGRVVECTSLENWRGSHLRGFESLFLRKKPCYRNDDGALFFELTVSLTVVAYLALISLILCLSIFEYSDQHPLLKDHRFFLVSVSV